MNFRFHVLALIAVCLTLIGSHPVGLPVYAQRESEGTLSGESAVTIEVFIQFSCPYCRAFSVDTLPQLQAEYADAVRIVVRPIFWDEPQRTLAIAAECARQQGMFWAVHEQLYDHSEATSTSALIALADRHGLDTTRFSVCLAEPAMAQAVLRQTQEWATRDGVSVPSVFIEAEKISGAQSYDVFAEAIDRALAETPSPPVRDSRWLSADQQLLVDDFGYPDIFRLMEVDDLDGQPARYEYWTYFKGSITYLFRDGVFLSASDETYPKGGVLPVPYRPEQFMLGESAQDVLARLGLEDVGTFAFENELLPGGDVVAADRLLLGFLDERLIFVETFAMTLGGER